MTPSEQHFLSVRYSFSPLLLIPLPSGEWAVAEGFNPFPLIEVCEETNLIETLKRLTTDQQARHRARQTTHVAKLPEPSLHGLTLEGI